MGRNGESGAFGLTAARGGVASAGVGARFRKGIYFVEKNQFNTRREDGVAVAAGTRLLQGE